MTLAHLPQFTIAIPVYNGAEYIAATLDSLLAQSYPHFEIVVLENGSTDKTVEIVQSYQDTRIRMMSSGKLLPIEQNWARILDIPNPREFLVLMCADDILYPQFLEKIADAIQKEPEASLYHSQAIFINEQGQFIGKCQAAQYKESADDFLDAVHGSVQDVFGTGYVMRFADFKAVGGYPLYIKLLFADIFCYYALSKKSYKICVQEVLVGFRRHGASTGFNAHAKEFESAAHDYRSALQAAGYLNSPERQHKTDFFMRFIGAGRLRYYVHDFIKAKQGNRAEFQAVYQSLPEVIKQRTVVPWDVPLNWYLRLALMQYYPLRIVLYYLILVLIRLRQWRYLQQGRYQLRHLQKA